MLGIVYFVLKNMYGFPQQRWDLLICLCVQGEKESKYIYKLLEKGGTNFKESGIFNLSWIFDLAYKICL